MAFNPGLRSRCILLSQRAPFRWGPRSTEPSDILFTRFTSGVRPFRTTSPVRVKIVAVPSKPNLSKGLAPKNAPITPPIPARRESPYAQYLAAKDAPTLLYEAPSHFWFTFSCMASGTFCAAYSIINYWTVYLNPPEGLHWVTVPAYGILICFMVACGGWFVMNATGIVRTIRAIPNRPVSSTTKSRRTIGTGKARVAASPSPSLQIEVSVRRLLPFMGPKKMVVPPEEIHIPFGMRAMLERLHGTDMRARGASREEKEAHRKYTREHILTAPFRDGARVLRSVWDGIKRSFFTHGFARIKVEKRSYRIDVAHCWALDNGKALDRLCSTQP